VTALEALYAPALQPYAGRIDAGEMFAEAEAATGLADWGRERWAEDRFRGRVAQFCEALEHEGNLSERGRSSAHSRLYILLVSRLRQIDWHARNDAAPLLPRPLVGAGMPRAGTTFLHNVLCQDPGNLHATAAQAAIPVLSAEADEAERNRVYNLALALQGFLLPELTAIHPFAAEAPEECVFMQEGACFMPLGSYYNVPSLAPLFADPANVADGYAWQRGVMQCLQSGRSGERWALKAPSHLRTPQALMAAFPDACIFLNHRDPAKVVPSMAGLYLAARGLSAERQTIDARLLGPQLLKTWSETMDSIEAWRKANPHIPAIDVHYTELIADPVGHAEKIYHAFGLTLTAAAKARIERFLKVDRHGKGPPRAYSLEQFGIDENAIEEAFGDYIDRNGIARERRAAAG
jgi:Sulfotransferase family